VHCQVVKVLQVNRATGHMDLSKRRVSKADREACKARFKKTKLVRSIFEALSDRIDIELLYTRVCWPLNSAYGHTYDAFKKALSDREAVLEGLEVEKVVCGV